MNTSNSKTQKGFTLVEIIITVAITGLVVAAIGSFQANIFSYSRNFSSSLSAADDARRVLRPFSNEVRSAAPSTLGAYPIEEATSTSFIFFTDTDNDGVEERIRYFLEENAFKKGTIVPSGNPYVYDEDDESIVAMVNDVTSSTVFSYFDTYYDGTTEALVEPISVLQIRLIKISLTIDKDPNEVPPPFTVTTQVSFRNLKDNL